MYGYYDLSAVMILVSVYAFVLSSIGIVCGVLTHKLAHKKGYTGYFWTGFFFGLIGLIYVVGLPVEEEKNKYFMKEAIELAIPRPLPTQPSYAQPSENAAPTNSPFRTQEGPANPPAQTQEQPPRRDVSKLVQPIADDHSDQHVVPSKAEAAGFVICPLCGTEQPKTNHSCWKCRANFVS